MEDLTLRQRRHVRTKDAILDAACQIISEDGVEKLSMRSIANRNQDKFFCPGLNNVRYTGAVQDTHPHKEI